ncbi:2952_t:CDS:2 [Entrophospora sp. SA101]|nr:2952_t:CDS:2 [Entrophospora sp. SA101]
MSTSPNKKSWALGKEILLYFGSETQFIKVLLFVSGIEVNTEVMKVKSYLE